MLRRMKFCPILLSKLVLISLSNIVQRCSIGVKLAFRLWMAALSCFIVVSYRSLSLVLRALCLASLSCWKIYASCEPNFSTSAYFSNEFVMMLVHTLVPFLSKSLVNLGTLVSRYAFFYQMCIWMNTFWTHCNRLLFTECETFRQL